MDQDTSTVRFVTGKGRFLEPSESAADIRLAQDAMVAEKSPVIHVEAKVVNRCCSRKHPYVLSPLLIVFLCP